MTVKVVFENENSQEYNDQNKPLLNYQQHLPAGEYLSKDKDCDTDPTFEH